MTTLARLTLAYLVLPLPIFLLGWVRWPVGVPLALLAVGVAARHVLRPARPGTSSLAPVWPWVVAGAVVWVAIAGAGPFGDQRGDWLKHNAMLRDLVFEPWPVLYAEAPSLPGPGRAALVYYLGYYLPPALVGKVLGWTAAYWSVLGWTAGGVALALLGFARAVGVPGAWVVPLLFVLASGLDVIGPLLFDRRVRDAHFFLRYESNPELLAWAPQHALAGWLGAAVLVDEARRRVATVPVALLLVATAFWSPFAAVGLLPFAAYWAVRAGRLPRGAGADVLVAGAVGAVVVAFFASAANPPSLRFLDARYLGRDGAVFVVFLVREFGVYAALGALAFRGDRERARLLGLVAGTLAVVPLGRMGLYNDWVERVSIPGLFVLWGLVAHVLITPGVPFRRVVGLAFLVGAVKPVWFLAVSLAAFRAGVPAPEAIARVPVVQGIRIASQYVADRQAFFFRHLAARR